MHRLVEQTLLMLHMQASMIGGRQKVLTLMTEKSLLEQGYDVLLKCFQNFPDSLTCLYNYDNIDALFKDSLIDINEEKLQTCTSKGVLDICLSMEDDAHQRKPSEFFMSIMLKDYLEYVVDSSHTKGGVFFKLMIDILEKTNVHEKLAEIRPVEGLVTYLQKSIEVRQINEITASDMDHSLVGLLNLLRTLFTKFPQMKEKLPQKNKFIEFILHDCLFNKDTV